MKFIINEKNDYQKYIIKYLVENNGYIQRANENFNPDYAMDCDCLFNFLYNTQPEKMEKLEKIYKTDFKKTLVNLINSDITDSNSSLIDVLKHGVIINDIPIDLMYTKPANEFNDELIKKYESNIFSVAEEVYASKKERIDLVIFLNGLPIISFELKSNTQGQNYEDAIEQYRKDRNPQDRLFRFKAGCFVNFAMDLKEVHMTTKLNGETTVFLPFNMGNGEGITSGSGNPIFEDKYSVYYMWEDILKKDSILELINKFIFVELEEKENELTGNIEKKENIIFPRYHQRDAIHKLLDDVYINKTKNNYLIQHSAGSGKTKTIAWLAYRLSTLHDENDEIIYDSIIVLTDRIVVDRQLQTAISNIEHQEGYIKEMDDDCNSQDLAAALKGNTKIIVTTIQKFPYIVDNFNNIDNKKFAVIIDEAHSSTAGKEMIAVTKTLGINIPIDSTPEEIISEEIKHYGKQSNVSMFAFTATPKATTLDMFGTIKPTGQKDAFHTYSMKQAIEEGFILDVLKNYITYKTYYELNKNIEDDPDCKPSDVKRKIARIVDLDDANISQRIEIIVEHFKNNVMMELDNKAKAMVVTSSREAAVKYYFALKKYVSKMEYEYIKPLVAFSGTVALDDGEYTEVSINGFSEKELPEKFDKGPYQILIVADKYQTGFDQPKLCAMYVFKKLKDLTAVQTLSRLNRMCHPYNKKTFILDFKNDYFDIEKAFSRYYDGTILSASVNHRQIYDIETEIDGYYVFDSYDVEVVNELLYNFNPTENQKGKIRAIFQRSEKNLEKYSIKEQNEFIITMRHFVRFYEFLLQASNFEDIELHKKYNFIISFLGFVDIRRPGNGFDLDGKISANNFIQKKTGEYSDNPHISDPIQKLPKTGKVVMNEEKERKLSEILRDINSRMGNIFDEDILKEEVMMLLDLLEESETLKIAAKHNTKNDFEFKFWDVLDQFIILETENEDDFFASLLNNKNMKKEIFEEFVESVYNYLRDLD